MIDIHCHALYGVDDGAKSMTESIAMLRQEKSQGVEAVILTPHYRHGMFEYPVERITKHFECLRHQAESMGVELYLGCEYHVNSRMVEALQTGRCRSLAGGDYVLAEYSYETDYSYIYGQAQKLLSYGYIPVVAHVERCACFLKTPKLCLELSNTGAYIQINADSILGMGSKVEERFCRKILKNQWADIVASDAHGEEIRACHLGKCKEYVAKKYGEDYAELLFCKNPGKIIEDGF